MTAAGATPDRFFPGMGETAMVSVTARFRPAVRLLSAALLLATMGACTQGSDRPAESASATPAADVASASSAGHDPATTGTSWQCGALAVTTRFDDASLASLTLAHADQELKLREVDADEGARFADEVGNVFWSRPGRVTLTLAGQPSVDCRKID